MAVQYARAPAVEAAPMQGETILFNAETSTFCVLNASAALVWNAMETPQRADVLADRLCAAFSGVSPEQARQDVDRALKEFAALSLIAET